MWTCFRRHVTFHSPTPYSCRSHKRLTLMVIRLGQLHQAYSACSPWGLQLSKLSRFVFSFAPHGVTLNRYSHNHLFHSSLPSPLDTSRCTVGGHFGLILSSNFTSDVLSFHQTLHGLQLDVCLPWNHYHSFPFPSIFLPLSISFVLALVLWDHHFIRFIFSDL